MQRQKGVPSSRDATETLPILTCSCTLDTTGYENCNHLDFCISKAHGKPQLCTQLLQGFHLSSFKSQHLHPVSIALSGTLLKKSLCRGRGERLLCHSASDSVPSVPDNLTTWDSRGRLQQLQYIWNEVFLKEWGVGGLGVFLAVCLLHGYQKHWTKLRPFLLFKILVHFT